MEFKIGNKIIGDNHPVYIIAEIGLNHQGDVKIARKLIDYAVEAGADAVKFQKRDLKKLYKKSVIEHSEKEEHGSQYTFGHIKNTELSKKEMRDLQKYALKRGVDFLCTPWDEESLKFLSKLGMSAYKVASADMFNLKLIKQIADLNKPMIISTGMSYVSEIEQLVSYLNSLKAKYVILHCNSTYPAPYHDINLKFINVMKNKFGCIVGYSGHEQGIAVATAAVAMGASVVEKHITLDRGMTGPDHRASLEPEEFKEMVKQIRIVESAMGSGIRFPSRGEYLNRETLSKSLVAARDLNIGDTLTMDCIDIKSPGKGTSPLKLNYFLGKKIVGRKIKKDDYLLESDISISGSHKFSLSVPRVNHKWGVVARMSDIDSLIKIKPDFVEIHLTDGDINADIEYKNKYDFDLCVHGPEYNGDILMDLSSLDSEKRKASVYFFNKALAHSRKLKKLFRNPSQPSKFVVHPGGMNVEHPLTDNKDELYKNLADSLKKLDSRGFELLIENMPALAWYFGGQWFHSSFTDAEEIVKFAKKYKYGIVFDTSHAGLYCNFAKKDLVKFAEKMLPVTRYIHISDAAGLNGEGLQIGDGGVDFKKLMKRLSQTDLWFLPEIWQGHKFGGFGFATAIQKLKEIDGTF
jgi:N-acetylneuraminate synthase